MITIFTSPKPFLNHIAVIQRNALISWTKLKPECEIILCGDDQGTGDFAREFGLKHIGQIQQNEYGSPLLSSLFNKVRDMASNEIFAYVNTDIILFDDFVETLHSVSMEELYLILGRRIDLDINEKINYDEENWLQNLQENIRENGKPHSFTGVDYYVFPKKLTLVVKIMPVSVFTPLSMDFLLSETLFSMFRPESIFSISPLSFSSKRLRTEFPTMLRTSVSRNFEARAVSSSILSPVNFTLRLT